MKKKSFKSLSFKVRGKKTVSVASLKNVAQRGCFASLKDSAGPHMTKVCSHCSAAPAQQPGTVSMRIL